MRKDLGADIELNSMRTRLPWAPSTAGRCWWAPPARRSPPGSPSCASRATRQLAGRPIGAALRHGRAASAPAVPTRPGDRFHAGSIRKPFVSVVVLHLVERGRLSRDAPLPAVLPADVLGCFPTGP